MFAHQCYFTRSSRSSKKNKECVNPLIWWAFHLSDLNGYPFTELSVIKYDIFNTGTNMYLIAYQFISRLIFAPNYSNAVYIKHCCFASYVRTCHLPPRLCVTLDFIYMEGAKEYSPFLLWFLSHFEFYRSFIHLWLDMWHTLS